MDLPFPKRRSLRQPGEEEALRLPRRGEGKSKQWNPLNMGDLFFLVIFCNCFIESFVGGLLWVSFLKFPRVF